MKLLTILLQVVFGAIVLATSTRPSAEEIQEKWKTALAPYVSICLCKSGVDPAIAELWMESGQITDDPCLRCFISCAHRAVGYYDIRNRLSVDVILAAMNKIDNDVPEAVVRDCVKTTVNITDLCLMSFTYSKCVLTKIYAMNP